MPKRKVAFARSAFVLAAAAIDILMIFTAAMIAGFAYHSLAFGEQGRVDLYAALGFFVALIFVLGCVLRGDYTIVNYLAYAGQGRRAAVTWTIAILCAMAGAFLAKTALDFSRATTAIFYAIGYPMVVGGRWAQVAVLRRSAREGRAPIRRVFLLGPEDETRAFLQRYQHWSNDMRIISGSVLRGSDHLEDDLALAAASARMLRPDDVLILVPWHETETIDACVNAFLRVPAAIHLGPERVLDRFADAKITRFGAVASLNLTGHPLTLLEIMLKRAFDLVLAGTALVLLAPLMALIALAIKLDSRGPVFFFQRRYGFNQEPFRIVKFRSMRTLDNGRVIEQAKAGDPRITRVGRFLRRFNLDELPQLANVLAGHMSLIGPRPHAMPHDQQFEGTIALYARRHNVKPGITGWAQVNGFRGETATDEAMRRRVEHDLWYIDNWSFLLDLHILQLTVFSPKAYRNAR